MSPLSCVDLLVHSSSASLESLYISLVLVPTRRLQRGLSRSQESSGPTLVCWILTEATFLACKLSARSGSLSESSWITAERGKRRKRGGFTTLHHCTATQQCSAALTRKVTTLYGDAVMCSAVLDLASKSIKFAYPVS